MDKKEVENIENVENIEVVIQKVYAFDVINRVYTSYYDRPSDTVTTLGDDRTFDVPPPHLDWHAIIRNVDNTAWSYVVDLRSQKQYSTSDGTESDVNYLGDLKDGFTLRPRPATYYIYVDGAWIVDPHAEAIFLADLKISKKIELTAARDNRIDAFDVITISKGAFNIDRVGLNKISNRLNAKQKATDDEVITSYVDTSFNVVDLTKDDVIDILDIQDDIESAIYTYHVDLIDQVNKAATVDAVEKILWMDAVRQSQK